LDNLKKIRNLDDLALWLQTQENVDALGDAEEKGEHGETIKFADTLLKKKRNGEYTLRYQFKLTKQFISGRYQELYDAEDSKLQE
jgi:hypothetical protein